MSTMILKYRSGEEMKKGDRVFSMEILLRLSWLHAIQMTREPHGTLKNLAVAY